jgi:glutamyl-tRNA reductase
VSILVAGVSHRTAPVAIRERLVVQARDVGGTLGAFRESSGAAEAAVVSTCNRTEFYVDDGGDDTVAAVRDLMAQRLGEDAAPFVFVRRGRDAVAHLFRVASGMDSMILGEAEIRAQVHEAWELSQPHTGIALNRLFQTALTVAARVRSETALGRGHASVSSAAVQLAKQIFGSLRGRRVMVLGAGEMAELALRCLVHEGVRTSIVANRTFAHAEELARTYGAAAMHYDQCWRELGDVDLLICSTAAPGAVVAVSHVEPTMGSRQGRPLCILDIALPRDVEPAVGRLNNVFLYDLDDLRAVASEALDRRREELPTAEAVIESEVDRYWEWLAGLAVVPVLIRFRSEMERLRERELAAAFKKMSDLGPADREAVEHFSKALMNKFLHEPSVRLRAAASNGRGLGVVDAVRYLFALDGEESDAPDREQPAPSGEEV